MIPVLFLKAIANQSGYYLIGTPARWHKWDKENPVPAGAHAVVSDPHQVKAVEILKIGHDHISKPNPDALLAHVVEYGKKLASQSNASTPAAVKTTQPTPPKPAAVKPVQPTAAKPTPPKPTQSKTLEEQLAAMKQSVTWGGKKYVFNKKADKWLDESGKEPAGKGEHYMLYGLAGLALNKNVADRIFEHDKDSMLQTGSENGVPMEKMLNILYPNAEEGDMKYTDNKYYTFTHKKWEYTSNEEITRQWEKDKARAGF